MAAANTFEQATFKPDHFATWHFGGGGGVGLHVVKITGKMETQGRHGTRIDNTRNILATITPGDTGVNYGFDEGEVN